MAFASLQWATVRFRPVLLLRILGLLGVVALALVFRRSILTAVASLANLNALVLLVLPVYWLWNHAAAMGWRALLAATGTDRVPSSARLALLRIEAQAVNTVLPLASLSGDVFRSSLVAGSRTELASSASAVILDTTTEVVGGLVFAAIWAGVHWSSLPIAQGSELLALGTVVLLAVSLSALPFALARLALLVRPAPQSSFGRALLVVAHAPKRLRAAFRGAVAWHVLERTLTAGEIYIVAHALGLRLGVVDALFATAVMIAFTLIFFFIPAQAGAAEGGLALAFAALGLPAAAGLTVALTRRARQLLVAALGLGVVLFWEGRHHRSTS